MEQKTDWRKFRKSTHLASADLDALETEGKKLIFTIKEVKYETGVDVSGTKMDGIFCYFLEPVKPLKLNSTNNKVLAGFAKKNGLIGKECHVIENWKGMKIELFVDRNVKMMGAITDGIRIKPLKLNSTNNKILAGFSKKNGLIGKECHVIENWKGMKIELYVDRNVKMMGAITDGVRIKPIQPIETKEKPIFTEANFEAAKKANATIEQIKSKYNVSKEIETKFNQYGK
jgi:hypothetical protein